MNLLPVPVTQPLHVDTSPESEMEVIREIDFAKRQWTARSDGLSPSFFNEGSDMITSKLT